MKDGVTLKWIKAGMKGQGAALAFVLVFCVAQAALAVLFALAVREIINAATAENAAYAHIVRCSVLLAATVCLQCALKLTLGFMRENMRTRTEISLRKRAFRAVLGGRYGEIAKYHSGDILNRVFTDASIVADGASAILPSLASAASRLIFTAAALFVLSPIFTAILLAACVVAFFVAMAFRKKLKGLHTEMREADGRSREFTQESVENLLAVKVFEAEDKFAAKGEKLLGDYRDKYLRRNRVSVLGTECFDIAFRVFYVAAMILGVFAIFRGETDYGTLAAMLQLIGQIQMPVIALSGAAPRYFTMLASAERLMELEKYPEEKRKKEETSAFYGGLKAIVFDGVYFSYGREPVLENVNLKIKKGQFAVIKGESGIGKSTLLKLALGVYRPVRGEVYFETAAGRRASASSGLFAYVPQGNMLFSGTVRENLLFLNENAAAEDVARALETAAAEFACALPEGLDTPVGENGFGLSEGQVQRLAIARALLTGAPVLFLDEATSALDAETEGRLLENLRRLGGRTVVLITHKSAAEKEADVVITIKNGEVFTDERA